MDVENMSNEEVWAAFGVKRPTIGRRAEIVAAAMRAGHVVDIHKTAKGKTGARCRCGFTVPGSVTFKNLRDGLVEHMILAGRTALGEDPLLGKVPPVGSDTPTQAVNPQAQPERVQRSSQRT